MGIDELITIDPNEAIRIIKRDSLLTTLLRVSDAGYRSLFTATSDDGTFLGVFSGETYHDRHVIVTEYHGSKDDTADSGFWVYDKARDLVAFHVRELRPGQRSSRPRFLWELSPDTIEQLTTEEINRAALNQPPEFELRAFQPGDWQRHVEFLEKNLGYKLKPDESPLGPVRLNEMFGANCYV